MISFRRHTDSRLSVETLESRRCLSAVAFIEHIGPTGLGSLLETVVGDFDGDGDIDLLTAQLREANQDQETVLAWFENTDGQGTFGPQRTISVYPETWPLAEVLIPADLDGDNDLDLLEVAFGHRPGPDVGTFWYPNIDGLGNFGPKIRISELTTHSTFAVDLDGDQDLDILSGTRWHENTDGLGSFCQGHDLLPTAEPSWRAAVSVDFDHDGDVDLVTTISVGENEPCTFGWRENVDGKGHFGDPQMIATWQEAAACAFLNVADVGADGDSDLISISVRRGQVAWLENIGGDQFREAKVVSTQVAEYYWPIVSDLDGDNQPDFIVNAGEWRGQPFWYVQDGKGSFEEHEIPGVSKAINYVSDVADINGDGRLDIIGSRYQGPDGTSSVTGGVGSDPFSGVKFACDAGLPAVENKTTASLDRTCRRTKSSTARLEQVQRDTCCSIAAT